MSVYEGLSLLISVISVIMAYLAIRKANSANKLSEKSNAIAKEANTLAAKANDIANTNNVLTLHTNNLAQQANMVSQGEIELSINSMINNTEKAVRDLVESNIKLTTKSKLTAQEKKELEHYENLFATAIEKNLNAYDEAAAKYLDSKVDKVRFKKQYQVMIRQLREDSQLRKYFDPTDISRYQNILKVYREWEGRD